MSHISILSLERISKKAEINRISREAIQELREYLEELAIKTSEKSIKLASHAKRRTVTDEDVLFATNKTKGD